VIVFRLAPVGEVIRDSADQLHVPGGDHKQVEQAVRDTLTEPVIELVEVEAQHTEQTGRVGGRVQKGLSGHEEGAFRRPRRPQPTAGAPVSGLALQASGR
jgi:hypothetical protein